MSSIVSPECSTKVLSVAPVCPKCGFPIENINEGPQLHTIQQTGKKLRGHITLSAVVFGIGFALLFGTWLFSVMWLKLYLTTILVVSGIVLYFGGMFWYLTTRYRIWWHLK